MNETERHERFEGWLSEHAAILHHVANGFAEGADRKDLMQELLLALWKAVPSFRNDARPSTFIYRVSHNTALTWKRTQRNYRNRLERFQAEPDNNAPAASSAREEALLEQLYAEIRRLPPVDRSLALLMLDGLSHDEMAAIHGLTANNVGVRIHRLKHKLTRTMKGSTTHEQR